MGRRKIEIKAIKDDRNRSVTFLKRKGGLFKKAHELSVLCSVDVAVIIFGSNKKLYEYSSGDIGEILTRYQFYGGANEHKGPADFNGKGKDDDDDDDDDGSGMSQHGGEPVQQQMLPPQFQNQAPFQHIRNNTPGASPPIQNGAFHPLPQRQHTPQHDSRPSSRNAPRRPSSNLAPQPANNYAFMPNPPMYNPHQAGMQQAHGLPVHMQGQPMQAPHHSLPPQQTQQYNPNYPAQQPQQQQQHPQQHPQQVHQIYTEEQRRSSMPPSYPQQERVQVKPEPSPPQPQQQQLAPPEHQEEEQQQQQLVPEQRIDPVKRMSAKSRSIFTPIDESRSILSQHWASSTSSGETPRSGTATSATSNVRSQSIDAGASSRSSNPPRTSPEPRNVSTSAASEGNFPKPSRTNSNLGSARRPILTVQIPDGGSDGESAAGDSSPHSATNAAHAQRNGQTDGHPSVSGVVLPPPSPSASALLSAGASGPPNPFARPHPVSQPSQSSNGGSMIETPVSALPSRFMNNEFLPSPSSFYPDWNFSREGNTLPSPLNFATPVVGTGPSFLRDDPPDNADKAGTGTKRKTPEAETPSGEDGGDSKRSRLAA